MLTPVSYLSGDVCGRARHLRARRQQRPRGYRDRHHGVRGTRDARWSWLLAQHLFITATGGVSIDRESGTETLVRDDRGMTCDAAAQ